MTKPELEAVFLSMYTQLLQLANKGLGQDLGREAVHQAYVLILENGTYKKLPRSRVEGRRFLYYKVRTAVERIRKKERKQGQMKGKGLNHEEVGDDQVE